MVVLRVIALVLIFGVAAAVLGHRGLYHLDREAAPQISGADGGQGGSGTVDPTLQVQCFDGSGRRWAGRVFTDGSWECRAEDLR